MNRSALIVPVLFGVLAGAALLAVYFAILTLVSGWSFAEDQFATYGYYVVALAAGFGIQVGMYLYLKGAISAMHGEGSVVGVTGATSTATMVSCCAHYLVNVLPILGIAGVAAFVAAYQAELFWVGIALNVLGILFISSRIIKMKKVQTCV